MIERRHRMNLLILTADARSRYAAEDYKVVASLSNDSPQACPFYDDVRNEKLEDFYDTYQFSVPENFEEADHIVPSNYVLFEDETNKFRLFRIIDVESGLLGNVHVKTAKAENAFVDDLLKTIVPRATLGTVNFPDAFAHCLANSGWQIRNSEYLGELKNQTFEGNTNAQEAIQGICKEYGGEIDAYVLMNSANKIIGKYFDLVEERGRNNTGKRFEYRRDITGVTRTQSISEFYTAIKPIGKDNLTIQDVNEGSAILYDAEANDLYNGGKEYLVKYMDFSEIEHASALYAAAKLELNKCNKPCYEYTVDTALLEETAGYEEEPAWLGDHVRVIDFEMKPPLVVGARIIEKDTSNSDSSKDKVTLGEYIELNYSTPNDIKNLQAQLDTIKNQVQPIYRIEVKATAGTIIRNGIIEGDGTAKLQAIVYRNNSLYVGTSDQYVWEKIYRDTGEHDNAWEQANRGVGPTVTVTGEDYARNCDFICSFVDDTYYFVTIGYFKTEVDRVAQLIESYSDDYAMIVFSTDKHYATDGLEYHSEKERSYLHALNAVELTYQTACDIVVDGGDIIDGKTSKTLAMANMQAMATAMNQAKTPVMFTKGNHDDNALGDARQNGGKGTELIRPAEMAAILKTNYTNNGIVHNVADDAIYSYYDVDDKKLRAIVIDTWDNRYDLLTSNGKIKYPAGSYAGYQQAQLTWLANTLLTTPKDYGVVLFTHMAIGGVITENLWTVINEDVVVNLLNAFKTGTAYSTTGRTVNNDYPVTLMTDFSTRGKGKLIGIFAGHTHKDIAKRVGFNTTPTILTNCSYAAGDNDDRERRKLGTVQEELFDVIAVSVEKNDIQLIRFGAKYNGQDIRQYSGGGNE